MIEVLLGCLRQRAFWVTLGSGDYNPEAKSNPLPVFIRKSFTGAWPWPFVYAFSTAAFIESTWYMRTKIFTFFFLEKKLVKTGFYRISLSGGIRDKSAHILNGGRIKPCIGHNLKPRLSHALDSGWTSVATTGFPFPVLPVSQVSGPKL